MNLCEEKYSDYALVREMLETVDVVRKFNSGRTKEVLLLAKKLTEAGNELIE